VGNDNNMIRVGGRSKEIYKDSFKENFKRGKNSLEKIQRPEKMGTREETFRKKTENLKRKKRRKREEGDINKKEEKIKEQERKLEEQE
jgi:hypothetical protein